MKNFDFAPNVVRTSYRSSFLAIIMGPSFVSDPLFLFVDEYSEFCLVSGASYLIRMLSFEQECRCRYEVICFHGISWLKSPFFSTGDSALASMPAFQPPFLCPSLPVGFLETVDLLPAYVQFCRRVPGCGFGLCRFFDDRFDVFCCSVSSC